MNHPKSLQLILLLAIVVYLSSCASVYYVPSAQNVPLHSEKGGVRAGGSIGTGTTARSLDFQGSYAFHNHLAIMANYQNATWDDVSGNEVDQGSQRYTEMGLGYFVGVAEKVVFETYVGGGGGTVTTAYFNGSGRLGFSKVFVQPQVGFATRGFEFAIGTRFYWLNYRDFDAIGVIPDEESTKINRMLTNRPFLLADPQLTVRFGHDPVKVQLQLVPVGNIRRDLLQHDNFMLSAGLQLKF